jgi:uncharacterized protein YndB with AHSA1/START domain
VPTARRSRTIAAPADDLWEVIRDPHHLPRWWPRVVRVEDVEGAAFTEVMKTEKGKTVRADFCVVEQDALAHRLTWEQLVEGTPFGRVLSSAHTEVSLAPVGQGDAGDGGATEVTIELRQTLNGTAARMGGFLVRRAAAATIEQALDGLERISG